MEWGIIIEFITSVGFPIVVAMILLDQNNKNYQTYHQMYTELKETIDRNTTTIEMLVREMQRRDREDT